MNYLTFFSWHVRIYHSRLVFVSQSTFCARMCLYSLFNSLSFVFHGWTFILKRQACKNVIDRLLSVSR
jgi:hypothetical protein